MLRQIIRAGNLSWSSYLKTESIKQVPQFPLRIYFKSFTSKLNDGVRQFQLFCLWMKSYSLNIQTKPLQQYFHIVLFIQYVVLTFESADEILQCDHSIVIQFLAELPFVTFCCLARCIFQNKVGKLRLTFTLANSGTEEVSKFVLQSKMGRTVSVSQTLVYAKYDIAQVLFSYVEKIPDDRGILFLDHPRFCRLMKTPNHTVGIADSMGWLEKNHKNRECSIFPTHPRLLISDHFRHGKTKNITVVDVRDRQAIVNFCLVKTLA